MEQQMQASQKEDTRFGKRNSNTTNLWPMLKLLIVILLISDLMPVVVGGQQKFGSLRLCPAGGRAFQMAWNLACDMKKRRKRSVEGVLYLGPLVGVDAPQQQQSRLVKRDQYRPATLSDIMQICCDVGCEIRDLLSYCDPFGGWNS